jgi:predicted Fe-Mo cluster-binding NifX family protein
MPVKITAAFATDDGNRFMERHFGDARFFDIYEIDESGSNFLKRVENTTDKDDGEDVHGDPVKAGGIMGMLLKEKATVAVSKNFGPNIKRVLKKFVCVRFTCLDIQEGIEHIRKNMDAVREELEKGEDRRHITLPKEN